MPKIELEYKCKKCRNTYEAAVNYTGSIEDIEFDENQSRCPFCGEWNCADPISVEEVVKDARKQTKQKT